MRSLKNCSEKVTVLKQRKSHLFNVIGKTWGQQFKHKYQYPSN